MPVCASNNLCPTRIFPEILLEPENSEHDFLLFRKSDCYNSTEVSEIILLLFDGLNSKFTVKGFVLAATLYRV